MQEIGSLSEFKAALEANPTLKRQIMDEFSFVSPLSKDKWIYRLVVGSLGLVILVIVIGIIVLMFTGKVASDQSIPTILTAIGSAAIGALAGLLAPSPKSE